MSTNVDKIMKKLDSDLAFFETELRGCGEFDSIKGISAGSEVACKPLVDEADIILGKVLAYHSDVGVYDIVDIDESKRYNVPENQVFILDFIENQRKLLKGESIHAIYPDTTSFYPAIVTQASRKSAMNSEPTVMLQFQGDADENGITPSRTVSLRYVMRIPPNSTNAHN